VNILVVTLSILIALFAGFAIGKTYTDIKCLRDRIASLESAQAKHLPYKTAESIEDAEAAIIKAMREVHFNSELLENALSHMQIARNGKD
jgi:hypothetical protein